MLAISCDALGFAYYFGIGSEYYELACERGKVKACMKIATAYERGIGVKEDIGRAMNFYQLACDAKDQWGCDEFERLRGMN